MSSSTLLSNYIHEYEQRQLQQLASSITSLCTEAPLQRKNFSCRFDESLIIKGVFIDMRHEITRQKIIM